MGYKSGWGLRVSNLWGGAVTVFRCFGDSGAQDWVGDLKV